MNSVELQVQGMSCGSCVKQVTQALRTLNGVREVTVDLQSGRVRVNGDPDSNALLAVLQEAGYPAHISEGAQSEKKTAGCGAKGSGCCCR